MVAYGARIALAGAAFLFLQLWERSRAQRSYNKFMDEKQGSGSQTMTMEQFLTERKKVAGSTEQLLVNTFTLDNLEGTTPAKNLQ